jgi:hypothetical protein
LGVFDISRTGVHHLTFDAVPTTGDVARGSHAESVSPGATVDRNDA